MINLLEKVNWLRESRGGYGYITPIAALVIKRNPQTVRIAVYNLRTKQVEYKNVKPEKLTPRSKHSVLDDAMEVACD